MADTVAFPLEGQAGVLQSQKYGCEEPPKVTQGYGELLLLVALQPHRAPPPHAATHPARGLCPMAGDGKEGLEQSRRKHQGWMPQHTEHTCM